MSALRADRILAVGLLWGLALSFGLRATGEEPAKKPAKADPAEEPEKINEMIEKAIDWYDVFPDAKAEKALKPVAACRWRSVVRGQKGEALMALWVHNGRPVAAASIYPWEGKMVHEFDSLSREAKLVVREKGEVIWEPQAAGVEFKAVPNAPAPAKTAAARLRQMKVIAEGYQATMTGWAQDNTDQEVLRFRPSPLLRYDLANEKDADPNLLDGGVFAYVQGTDPEVVLILEAIKTEDKTEWQAAFVRATSGGLEVKLGDELVWSAKKHPANRNSKLPHFSMHRVLEK
jgi:hypothetical protein